MQPSFEVAQILERLSQTNQKIALNPWQSKTLNAVRLCRTAALGGHIDACDDCGKLQISYNSCRNRHCPKCQGHKRESWIQAREAELLPVPYFHVVFTLPSELNGYALSAPKVLYETLFDATWDTMQTFGKNKGLKMGLIAVLHTWGQNLSLHPHLHCIVPGGGTNSAGEWQNLRSDGKYLFCVKALAKVFRAKFLSRFLKHQAMESKLRNDLYGKPWVVYAKKPFGTPKSVVEYLGRYTHKIAISNHRIKNIDEHTASFEYKDYKAYGQKKLMKLSHQEFIRRFALHILPRGFVKMRHYGILSSTWKRSKLKKLQADLHLKPIEGKSKGTKLKTCPCCKKGKLITVSTFGSRGPPAIYMGVGQTSSPCNS